MKELGAAANAAKSPPWPEEKNGFGKKSVQVRALAAYKDFLTLWKDADPEIPIYKQSQSGYAKLQ